MFEIIVLAVIGIGAYVKGHNDGKKK